MEAREILRKMKKDSHIAALKKRCEAGKQAEKDIREFVKENYASIMTKENGFEREELSPFLFIQKNLDVFSFPEDLRDSWIRLCKLGATWYFFSDEGWPLFCMKENTFMHSERIRKVPRRVDES